MFLEGSKSFTDPDDSAIDGTGVDHIFEVIDDKRNPGKTDAKKQEDDYGHYPHHGTILIVDSCSNLEIENN